MDIKPIKPNFFIIGAPKCGTTALSEYLRTHPNVFFSHPKEPQYYASDFNRRVINNAQDYMRLFQKANPSKHLAIGEGSALYFRSNVAVSNILKFQPNAKFILMLRNPVELVISLHAEALISSGENLRSFSEAWNIEEYRKQGKFIPLSCTDPKHLCYSEWGRLGTQLKRVLKIVSREQINIVLFDDFIADTRSVYKNILDFLELPDDGRQTFPKINERLRIRYFWLHRLLVTMWRFWLPARRKLTGGKGFGLVNYVVRKWNSSSADKTFDPELYEMLLSFYSSEIILLEEILDRDLSHWKKIS
jgi:hypothetical protein